MEFIPYEPEHIRMMGGTVEELGESADAMAAFHANHPASTLVHNDEPLVSFGITPIWDHSATVWAVFSDSAADYGAHVYRYAKQFVADISEQFERVQCDVSADLHKARRFVEMLGFAEEAVMRKYGPNGEDFCRYARVS